MSPSPGQWFALVIPMPDESEAQTQRQQLAELDYDVRIIRSSGFAAVLDAYADGVYGEPGTVASLEYACDRARQIMGLPA